MKEERKCRAVLTAVVDAMYEIGAAREVILEAAEIAAFRLDEAERDLLRLAVEVSQWEGRS